MRDITARLFLNVVRREPLIVRTHEDLEVSPGAAGNPPQQDAIIRVQPPSWQPPSTACVSG